MQWMLEIACSPDSVVEHEADEGLPVVDLVGSNEGEGFGKGKTEDLNVLVGLGSGGAFADVAGGVDLHPLTQETGAGKIFCQQGPTFGAIASLFDQLTPGCGGRCFLRFNATRGKFDEELAGSVTVLALKDNLGVAGVFGFVDGENDDRPIVTNDVADVDIAAWFFDLVTEDGKDPPFVGEFGGDKPWFCGKSFLWDRFRGGGSLYYLV